MLADIAVMGVSFILGMIQKSMQNNHEQRMTMMSQAQKDVQRVRLVDDDFFKWTRRTIALIATAYIFLGPAISTYLGITIWTAYTEDNSWLLSLFIGDSTVMFRHLPDGFVILPIHTYIAEAIVGLYFGRK
jgi:hypothetical protein